MENKKCVIVIDQDLDKGVVANTAAVLSLSLGKHRPELIGADLRDHKNHLRLGITAVAIPILKSTGRQLKEMREALKAYDTELTVIDLTTHTRGTRSYKEYAEKLENTPVDQLQYQGIALYGERRLITKFTGNLALLR